MMKFLIRLVLLVVFVVVVEGAFMLFNNYIFMVSPLMLFTLAVLFLPILIVGILTVKAFRFFQKKLT